MSGSKYAMLAGEGDRKWCQVVNLPMFAGDGRKWCQVVYLPMFAGGGIENGVR